MTISVVIADDLPIVRRGLKGLLDADPKITLAGEASDGQEAVKLVKRLRPHVVLLDWMMPVMNGLEAARQIIGSGLKTRIIFLSVNSELAYVVRALQEGASGYILKTASASHILGAIHAAYDGDRYLSPEINEETVEIALKGKATVVDGYDMLSAREREIFQMVAEGHTSRHIGGRFFISPRTVEVHRGNIMRKLGLKNQVDLIRFAMKRGLLPE